MKHLIENYKLVQLTSPVTSNGGFTSDYVSLKNCNMAYVVVNATQAVGHGTTFAVVQATAVAGTSVKAIANAVPIWMNADVAATDTLVAQTAAVSQAVAADVKHKQIVFQIDPTLLDVANGFDCIAITVDNSGQATNFVSIDAWLDERYQGNQPPAAITD